MNHTRKRRLLIATGTAFVCLSAAIGAAADPNTKFTAPAFFGQAGTTYQEWDGYSSPTGPNAPTYAANPAGTANWFDTTAATDGAFPIGIAPNAHIYSFSGVLNPEVFVPGLQLGTAYTTTLVLQLETQGNPIDTSSVKVTPVGGAAFTFNSSSVTTTPIPGGFGGDDSIYQFTWSLPGSAAGYTFDYSAGQTSVSQVATRVDILTAPAAVPEAATSITFGAFLGFGLLMLGVRAVKKTT